ncbi:MAG TPA: efflux transporter outer membrane subunit [Candidatus Binataceae bacterium]|nr:efflux transporter outer membrane subunit [Candidatus Binataceae bacterium]
MFSLAACMIGPDFKRPPVEVRQKWMESGDASVADSPPRYRDWWDTFSDPVLTRLIHTAYAQNLTLRAAGVRVLESRAQLGIAIGEFYPQQQQINASVTYNRIPASIPYNLINNRYWADSIGAQAGWELDLWGKLRRGIESADDAFLASVAQYDDVLVTLTADVASNYVTLRATQTELAIAQENVKRQRDVLQVANDRFTGGVTSQLDVYQAQNVLGATEATIPQLAIQIAQIKNAMSVLIGLPAGAIDMMLGSGIAIPATPAAVAVGIPADLLRRRPDIRSAELLAAAQCAQIGVAKADLLPALTLIGNVSTVASNTGSNTLTELFTSASLAFSAGPSISWNILNYGQITNNVRLQDAKFQELLVNYQNSVLNAQSDVENALALFTESRKQAAYLAESVIAAAGAMQISLIQYKEGITIFTAVLLAEENLLEAEDNYTLARANIPLGLINTYRALGGGWEIREGHDFVPVPTQAEMAKRTNWGRLLNPELLQPAAPGLPAASDRGPLVRPPE